MTAKKIVHNDIVLLDYVLTLETKRLKLVSVEMVVPKNKVNPVLRISYEDTYDSKKIRFLWFKLGETQADPHDVLYAEFSHDGQKYLLYQMN
jgi:hypothetical protein